MEPVRSIIVLGGGSAGFLAAIALRTHHADLPVRLIRSKDIGIIGVGEGTTVAVPKHLHHFLNLDVKEFYREVNPIWKLGIRYLWGPRPEFNFTFAPHLSAATTLPLPIGYFLEDDISDASIDSALMSRNRAFHREPGSGLPFVTRGHAYHLENRVFVAYLEEIARRLGTVIVDDTVRAVQCDESGVGGLSMESGATETADLYVDSSGFASELLGRALKEPFISFAPTLFCDRAVIGGWDRQADEPIQPYTTAETMDAGWAWRIDHEHAVNRGYVYSSSFISDEQAELEYRQKNPRVRQTRIVKFRTGRYQRSWVKNVVAVGNAGGFVEPLEATAIAAICEQTANLAYALFVGGRRIGPHMAALCNERDARYWDAIRRFLAVHYKFNTRLDTPFWQAAREKTDLAGAETLVDFYQENGPSATFAPTLIDPHDQFGIEGYLTMLVGQRAPYRNRARPSAAEMQQLAQIRERNRAQAAAGYTVEEALRIIRLPEWNWTPGFFR